MVTLNNRKKIGRHISMRQAYTAVKMRLPRLSATMRKGRTLRR